jgi:hypothetical protein
MAELNPFQAPSEKPASDRYLTDAERLKIPDELRARETFGDRYFWPIVVLFGVSVLVVPRVLFGVTFWKIGGGIVLYGLWRGQGEQRAL